MTKIILKKLSEYPTTNLEENIKKMLAIYCLADSRQVNKPNNDSLSSEPQKYYFVLNESLEIVGVGAVNLEKCLIQKLFILPEHRKKGYGAAFILEMEKILKNEGAEASFMFVKFDNFLSALICQKLGYFCIPYDETNAWSFKKILEVQD